MDAIEEFDILRAFYENKNGLDKLKFQYDSFMTLRLRTKDNDCIK